MSKTKIIDIAVAVIAAICLWAYVINIVNPPTTEVFRDIPVVLKGSEVLKYNHLAISGEGDYTVDVVLGGSRLDLNGISAEDIYAEADLSSLKIGQNYITVSAKCPDVATINEIRSQKIQVYVEELVVQDKPLNIQFVQSMEGYEPTILKNDSEVVAVSGAKSFVDSVAEVRVDIDVTKLAIDTSTSLRLDGAPLDADGKLVDSVNVSDQIDIAAVLYGTKTVPLNIKITGSPAYGASVRSKDFPTDVVIKGTAKRLAGVNAIDVPEISIAKITSDKNYVLEPELPFGIYLADENPELTGSITLVNAGSNKFSYKLSDITVIGLADDMMCTILTDGELNVTAKATLDLIKKLDASEVAPCIDITGLTEGVYSVAVSSLHGNGGITYEFSPSVVDVRIEPAMAVVGFDEDGNPIYEPINKETEEETAAE